MPHGGKDEKVSRDEINSIFKNLHGPKKLKIYENAGHENYLVKYEREWTHDVGEFLTANK
jgi:alpha-beta hydrolase superfamily lysophospholipase